MFLDILIAFVSSDTSDLGIVSTGWDAAVIGSSEDSMRSSRFSKEEMPWYCTGLVELREQELQ